MPSNRGPNNDIRPAICHPNIPYYCRGLCHDCYDKHYAAGTLDQFPTRNIPITAVLDAYKTLTPQGLGPHAIAEHLGMNYTAYYTALRRARDKGLIE